MNNRMLFFFFGFALSGRIKLNVEHRAWSYRTWSSQVLKTSIAQELDQNYTFRNHYLEKTT